MPDLYNPLDGQPWPQERFARQAPTWAPSGVIGTPQTAYGNGPAALSFAVAGSVITVALALFRANARGFLYERTGTPWQTGVAGTQPTPGTSAYTLNSNSNPRIDRLVLRRDLAAGQIYPFIIQGSPAAVPQPPSLVQNETGVWDTPLFLWTLAGSNSTNISAIADQRPWVDPDGNGQRYGWIDFPAAGAPFFANTLVTGGTDGSAAGSLSYRREGFQGVMRGWATSTNGLAAGVILSTALPAEFRPPVMATLWPKLDGSTPAPVRFELGVNGVLKTVRAIPAGSFLNFDDVSWPLT